MRYGTSYSISCDWKGVVDDISGTISPQKYPDCVAASVLSLPRIHSRGTVLRVTALAACPRLDKT
jgi:hypothetical protein